MWQEWDLDGIAGRARHLPDEPPERETDVPAELELFADGAVRVLYAPLGYVNPAAKVAIVGLTPGWQQTRLAYGDAIQAIRSGVSPVDAHRMKKPGVAFAGSMRRNLVGMLDEIELHRQFEVASTLDLFGTDALHTTSALRFPVFSHGRNYSGGNPSPTRHPALVSMLERVLAPELDSVPGALVVPLGVAVSECLSHLCARGMIDARRCLTGFPHPSGANGHRLRQFEAEKQNLRADVLEWFGA